MRLYTIIDDISGKKVAPFTELDDDKTAKRAYAFALSTKTGPLSLVAYKPIDFRLVYVGDCDMDGTIHACEPVTVCRMDDLEEVR